MKPRTSFSSLIFFAAVLLFSTGQILSVGATNTVLSASKNASAPETLPRCPLQPIYSRPPSKNAKKFLPIELIRAVYAGDLNKLKVLVTDENVLLQDSFNNTLAHLAAQMGCVEILRFLIGKENALIEAKGLLGYTPLILAVTAAHECAVKLLLENDADPNARPTDYFNGGSIAVDALHVAADHGYLDIVMMLLQHGANISSRDGDGRTPFHLAVKAGHLEVVKYLIEWYNSSNDTSMSLGADLIFAKDKNGSLPIHYAATAMKTEIVSYLVSVSLRQLAEHGRYNQTALHIAASNNDVATIREILKYQPNLEALANYVDDPNGTRPSVTALMLASGQGHEYVVRLLLEAGANATVVDWMGNVAIHRAARLGSSAIAEALVDKNPQSVNYKGNRSCTPLHYAVANQRYDVVLSLLKRGANLSARAIYPEAPDTTAPSATPLLYSAIVGNRQTLRLLVESGAQMDQADSQNGQFPIHGAALNGNMAVVEELLARDPCQLEWRDFYNNTPLHGAIAYNHTEMAKYLIRKGANLEAKAKYSSDRSQYHSNPLISATRKVNYVLVEDLLRNGANPQVVDEYGSTALHYAAMLNATGLIELLIQFGAQGGRDNIYGDTPTELAFNNFNYNQPDHFALLVANDPFPLHRAVEKENVALVKRVVHLLPSRLNQRSQQGETALEMAVRQEKVNMAVVLIEAGLRVDTINADGNTLLHMAASISNASERSRLEEMILHELGAEAKPLIQLTKDTASARANFGHNQLPLEKRASLLQHGASKTLPTIKKHQRVQSRTETSYCRPAPITDFHLKGSKLSLPVELLKALYAGDFHSMKALITRKNILLRDAFNNTLAVIAAQRGDINALHYLISREKSLVNTKGVADYSPLHSAVKHGHTELVEFLLDAGADVDALAKYGGDETFRGFPFKMQHSNSEAAASATPLHLASKEGRLDSVKLLLRHDANTTASDWHGRTPLHWAVMMGHLDVVKQLVSFSADSNSLNTTLFARDADGDMPIHDAVYESYVSTDIVRYLLGVDRRQLAAHGAYNWTILHITTLNNYVATIREILKYQPNLEALANYGDDPNGTPPSVTAFMMAAGKGHDRIVRMLLRAGANDTAVNWMRNSAMHVAAKWGHSAVIKALLDKNPLSVNHTGNRSYTPLHYAVVNQHYEVVLSLLKRGANLSARATYWNFPDTNTPTATPLLFAAIVNLRSIFRALVESGAQMDQADSQTGQFPIHLAAANGRIAMVEELLARNPCQLEWRDFYNNTPLHSAIANNQTEMAEYLLGKGANVNAKSQYFDGTASDELKLTPLILAASNANQALMEALLLRGADSNNADRSGLTSLHFLLALYLQPNANLYFIIPHLIDLLIRYGAAIEMENYNGLTSTERAFSIDPDGHAFRLLAANDPQPLHRAVMKNNIALIRKAVHLIPTRLDQRNSQGETALEMAVRLGKVQVEVAMIEAGLRVDTVNANGNTLLHIASRHPNATKRAQLVEMIVRDAGAEVLASLVTRRNQTGVSVIDIAKRDSIMAKLVHVKLHL